MSFHSVGASSSSFVGVCPLFVVFLLVALDPLLLALSYLFFVHCVATPSLLLLLLFLIYSNFQDLSVVVNVFVF